MGGAVQQTLLSLAAPAAQAHTARRGATSRHATVAAVSRPSDALREAAASTLAAAAAAGLLLSAAPALAVSGGGGSGNPQTFKDFSGQDLRKNKASLAVCLVAGIWGLPGMLVCGRCSRALH